VTWFIGPVNRKFPVPPVVSCVIALITLLLALSALPKELMESAALSTSGLVAVFLAVWGATDVARSGQKVFATGHQHWQRKRAGIGRVCPDLGAGRPRGHSQQKAPGCPRSQFCVNPITGPIVLSQADRISALTRA
jgi:hypothetical protein